MRHRFASLSSRLLLTVVAMVALVSVLIGTTAALAMRANLVDQLDQRLQGSAERAGHAPPDRFDGDHDEGGPGDVGNQAPGTLIAVVVGGQVSGVVLGNGFGTDTALSASQAAALVDVSTEPTSVDLPQLGDYRVVASVHDGVTRVTGLPLRDTDQAVLMLVAVELGLALLGTAVAGALGSAAVRRQLRPLREVADTAHRVAELPLATGEVAMPERVPDRLTDERTEVGQVGHALNTLLSHVETSLAARHRSDQQVRQFVADAAHELRTPLATIAGYTELARRRPEEETAALTKVEAEARRMSTLVEDLLLLARLDAGRPLASETVDLTRLAIDGVSDARVLAPDHRWRLDLPDEAVQVTGDEARLHQVLSNLLTNARTYTPAGTTVTVRVRAAGDARLLAVQDDGPGVPADIADRAFERFVRADTARTRSGGGTGLGLALVRAIVTAHHGTVTLQSRPGATAVTVRLPA